MQRYLNLLVPSLFGPEIDAGQSDSTPLKALKLLLARAEPDECAPGLEACLFELFGIAPDSSNNLPIAAVTHILDTSVVTTGWWLRADPVCLQVDNARVVMLGNDLLNIDQEEASALAEEINALFTPYGWRLEALCPKRWYLRLAQDPGVFYHPLSEVVGSDVHQYLPRDDRGGEQAKFWRRLLNETQMLLFTSAINSAREARLDLPINSLWFWGGGTLGSVPERRFAHLWSNEPLSSGLAKFTTTPHDAAPATGTAWLAQAVTPGEHLVVLETDNTSHAGNWRNSAATMNMNWFSPLLAALKSREIDGLRIYAGNGKVFHVTPTSLSRWWKRPRNLALYQ